jgi:hypothetical protein
MRIDGYNIFQLLECHPRMLKKIIVAEKNFFAPLIVVSKQRERTLLIFIDAKIEKICLHRSKLFHNFAPANEKTVLFHVLQPAICIFLTIHILNTHDSKSY